MTEPKTNIAKVLYNDINSLSATIQGVTDVATNYLDKIDNIQEYAKNKAQEKIDDMCERVTNEMNQKLASQRQILINKLKESWTSAKKIEQTLSFVTGNINIDTIVSIVTDIITLYTKPYQEATALISDMTLVIGPKLLELTSQISTLTNLKNDIPKHILKDGTELNYNKLNITMEPISIDDIRPDETPQENS